MKHLKNYNNFINEKLGVSEITLIYGDLILKNLKSKFNKVWLDDEPKSKYNITIDINKNKIDNFEKLPVDKFLINFIIERDVDGYDLPKPYTTSGLSCEFTRLNKEVSFSNKKSGIIKDDIYTYLITPRIDVTIYLGKDYIKSKYYDKLMIELDSTIIHELNHLLESYQRVKKDVSNDIDPYIGVVNVKNPDPKNINDKLYNRWVDFTYLIYYSEPHEINAVTQESLPYIKSKTPYEEMPGWKIQNKLNSFVPDDYIKEMMGLAKGNIKLLQLLKDDFMKRFKGLLISQGRKLNDELLTKHDVEFLEKCTFNKFVKHFGFIIEKSGKRLKKNILRLNTYEKD